MGANFVGKSYDGKMTSQQVMKAFSQAQEDDRYENGNDYYSGGIAGLTHIVNTGKVFNTWQEAENAYEDGEKGTGYLIRVKEFDPQTSKRYVAASAKASEFDNKRRQFARENPKSKRNATYQLKSQELWQKVREMEKALGEKAKKFKWSIIGWSPS